MIADLIARVEAATGPDREIDEAVCRYFGSKHGFVLTPLTASIDAVVELIRREMPGACEGYARKIYPLETWKPFQASVWIKGPGTFSGDADTPALALLLAFLRAMQARQENDTP